MAINREAPYFQTAKIALIQWNGKTPEEADKILSEQSVAEIENQVGARGSMTDAVMHIGEKLGLSTYESYILTQEVLGLTTSRTMTDLAISKVQQELASRDLEGSKEFAADLLISTADATHKGWTERNSGVFFGKKDIKDQQYQFATSDFIGFKEVQSDLFFITPIAEAIHLPVNSEELLREYHDVTVENLRSLKEQGIEIEGVGGPGVDTIREMVGSLDELMQGDRVQWTPDVAMDWQNNDAMLDQVTKEIMEKGIGKDNALMNRLMDEGILNREDPDGLDDYSHQGR